MVRACTRCQLTRILLPPAPRYPPAPLDDPRSPTYTHKCSLVKLTLQVLSQGVYAEFSA